MGTSSKGEEEEDEKENSGEQASQICWRFGRFCLPFALSPVKFEVRKVGRNLRNELQSTKARPLKAKDGEGGREGGREGAEQSLLIESRVPFLIFADDGQLSFRDKRSRTD